MALRCKNLFKLSQPLVRCLRPIQSFVIQPKRDLYRRGDDFFGTVFYDLNRAAKDIEKVVDSFGRDGFSGVYRNLSPYRVQELPIVVNEDGTRLYRLKFYLQDFQPENIKLTIKDFTLTVEAKGGTEKNDQDLKLKCYKDLRFEYALPKSVNIEQISSKRHSDGSLLVECPLPKLEMKDDDTVEIPIEKA